MKRSKKQDAQDPRCSFCDKPRSQVRRLLAGPGKVSICEECVGLCQELLGEEGIRQEVNTERSTDQDTESLIEDLRDLEAALAQLAELRSEEVRRVTVMAVVDAIKDITLQLLRELERARLLAQSRQGPIMGLVHGIDGDAMSSREQSGSGTGSTQVSDVAEK